MPNLNLDTIELVSMDRPMPANGAPSSSDYNDSMREILADLASITEVFNDSIRPLLNALPDTAGDPSDSPVGIEGRTIYTDTSDSTQLFFDEKSATALTIADTIRLLNGMIQNVTTKLADVDLRVTDLNTKLSATNQNDIARQLQSFSDTLTSISNNLTSTMNQVSDLVTRVTSLETEVSQLEQGSQQ